MTVRISTARSAAMRPMDLGLSPNQRKPDIFNRLPGSDVAVICLATNQTVRLLDFELIKRAFTSISAFDPEFIEKSEKHAFLKLVHRLISRPVLPGRETEYLITQTMAEYLSHIHRKPFDGVLFSSAQQREGTNIVLFLGISGVLPVTYVEESLKVFEVRAVQHDLEEKFLFIVDGRVSILDYDSMYDYEGEVELY